MDGAFGAPRGRPGPSINITPLIDVMFLLLIFFMVSSTFRDQTSIDIALPRASSGAQLQAAEHEIAVTDTGAIYLDDEALGPGALKARLAALLAEEPEAALLLRADEAASWQAVLTVIDVAREVGGAKLIVPTRLPGPTDGPAPE